MRVSMGLLGMSGVVNAEWGQNSDGSGEGKTGHMFRAKAVIAE